MRRGKRFSFDVRAAIPAAWEFLWANNLKQRAKNKPENYGYARYFYLCAADVENQVREFAEAAAQGKPWSETRVACGRPMGMVRISGNLQRAVRDWLLDQVRRGVLQSHNFGRGHISGMRFRPAGEPLSEAEQKTFTAKAQRAADWAAGKKPPLHFSKGGYGGFPACTAARRSGGYSRGRSSAVSTHNKDKVTCPRCLKLLKTPSKPAIESVG